MYNLPQDYQSRMEPAYFDDILGDSTAWQADVYWLAAHLARKAGVQWLKDIGCGNGKKLLQFGDEFLTLGIDYGANILHQPITLKHKWQSVDLNTHSLMMDYFDNSVVICADVIEHLPNPMPLIQSLRNACEVAPYVLLSTPDRERVYKGEHNGPPGNPYHCREWTNAEWVRWLRFEGLPVQWFGWTISNRNRPDQVWTSLVVLSKTELVLDLPPQFEPAPVEWDSLGLKHA